MVQKLAHCFLCRAELRMNTIGTVRGTEAETIALVVGGSIGLDTGNPSASTIQQRHGNSALR